MYSSAPPSSATAQRQTSLLQFPAQPPDAAQLDSMKTQLDLVLVALEALLDIGSDAILQAAEDLKVAHLVSGRVALWRLRQSNPLRKGSGGRKKLDIEEARALVLISCYLAAQHQEKIRRAVALLEQLSEENRPPHQAALLGDYLDQFTHLYQDRMSDETVTTAALARLALKLLVDLLFYSGPGGSRRLWVMLLERTLTPTEP